MPNQTWGPRLGATGHWSVAQFISQSVGLDRVHTYLERQSITLGCHHWASSVRLVNMLSSHRTLSLRSSQVLCCFCWATKAVQSRVLPCVSGPGPCLASEPGAWRAELMAERALVPRGAQDVRVLSAHHISSWKTNHITLGATS